MNQKEILEELLHEMVSQAIEKGFINSRTLIMDATHTTSQYVIKIPIEILREVSKTIRKQLYRYAPELKDLVPPKLAPTVSLEEEITDKQELIKFSSKSSHQNINIPKATEKALNLSKNETYQTILSLSDSEAKIGYKSKTEAFDRYKSHLAITEERLITAIEVKTGEARDGKYLKSLVEN